MLEVGQLVRAATAADGFLRVLVRPGDQVLLGTPVAYLWGAGDEACAGVLAGMELGYERTFE